MSRPRRAICAVWLAVLAACTTPSNKNPGYYTVREGDTLYKIAREQDQSVEDLIRWNRLRNAAQISVGMLLRVRPPHGDAAGRLPAPADPGSSPPRAPAARAKPQAPVRGIALAWPAQGTLTKSFDGGASRGLTIANREGTPVLAAAAGTVAYSSNGVRGYGNLVIVRHTGGFLTIYAHNRKLLVKQGEAVKQGQRIAEMGKTDASEPGLYFELRQNEQPVNPQGVLPTR
jgi:murein DD-endopeptidase MepM/ murein hydrolase activator NlpD